MFLSIADPKDDSNKSPGVDIGDAMDDAVRDYASVHIDEMSKPELGLAAVAEDLMTLRAKPLTGWAKFSCHVRALLWKRFLHARRDRQTQLWTVLYPLLILFLGCGVLEPPKSDATQPVLPLVPSNLPDHASAGFFVPVRISSSGAAPSLFTVPVFGAQWTPLGASSGSSNSSNNASPLDQVRQQTQQWLLDTSSTPRQSYNRFIALDSSLEHSTAGSGNFTAASTVYFNTTTQWSSLLGVNVASNALLHALTGSSASSITVSLHPLPTLQLSLIHI